MARPTTYTDVWTRLGYAVTLWNEIEKFGNANTGNYKTLYEAIVPQMEGDFLPMALTPFASGRKSFASLISQGNLRAAGQYFAREFGRVLAFPETGQDEIAKRLRVYMAELVTPATLNRREMTLGAVTNVGTPTGTGTIHKVTTDEYGYPIENISPDLYTFRCIADQDTVAKHEEIFEVRSGDKDYDGLTTTGQGIASSLRAISARHVQQYLANPSFTSYSGTGASLAFTNWTLSAAASFAADVTNYYKTYEGEGDTPVSLQFTDNGNVYQQPTVVQNSRFSPDVPWFFDFALRRDGNCDGTLTVAVGTQTRAITISGQTNETWARYTVPSTIGQNSWIRNWHETDFDIRFTLASNTTGTISIDDIVFYPMQPFAKHYYIAVGGVTPWVRGDSYTVTNTDGGTRAKLAYWCWRMGWPNFPTATGAAETIADPADPA